MPELTEEIIAAVIAKRHPSTLASLKKRLEDEGIQVSDDKLLPLIRKMQARGNVKLYFPVKASFEEYLTSYGHTWWVYLATIVAVSESYLVFLESQTTTLLFLRIVLGLGVLGFIPGFLTVRIIFPGGQINILEQVALSIFLSVLISISIGVVLGLGLFFQPSYNALLLSLYVLVSAPLAAYRSYRYAAGSPMALKTDTD